MFLTLIKRPYGIWLNDLRYLCISAVLGLIANAKQSLMEYSLKTWPMRINTSSTVCIGSLGTIQILMRLCDSHKVQATFLGYIIHTLLVSRPDLKGHNTQYSGHTGQIFSK